MSAAVIAELIEDRGEAAVSDEFFRSREFLGAEGVTHTLRIQTGSGELVAPLVVREIEGAEKRDAVSPYGYPGLVSGGSPRTPIDPAVVDFSGTGLVSLFVRHTLDEPPLSGATDRNIVQIADPALPPKSRPSDRRQIRRNLEAGYELELVPGRETNPGQRAGFLSVYEQTMRRTDAGERYFFGAEYFDRVLAADRTWLVLVTAPGGEIAAASLAAVSDGYLHYYLSGTDDSHLRASPMKNVVARLSELATELALPLNLGGGISPGDALEEFKRGFANRQEQWHTSEIVCDRDAYERLSAGRDTGGYFPAYRAP